MERLDTYNWESPGHADEGNGRESHEGGDDQQEGITTATDGLINDWVWEHGWLYWLAVLC